MNTNILKKFIFVFIAFSVMVCSKTAMAAESYWPDGTLLKANGPEVFVLENGLKRWIINPEIFNGLGYNWKKIVKVTDQILSQYPTGQNLTDTYYFPDGTLLKGSGEKVYLIKNGSRRWIPNPTTFDNLGLRWENIIQITDEKLSWMYESESLSIKEKPKVFPETWFAVSLPEFFTTNQVTFKFSGRAGNKDVSSLNFETFLDGYDSYWVDAWGGERTLFLDPRETPYIFFVRAKDDEGNYDPTPARHSFYLKISPRFGKITISYGELTQSDPAKEYVSLYNYSQQAVDITGWSLNDLRGNKYIIPRAKEFIGRGYSENEGNIRLPSGGQVLIFSGFSPNGWSFRLNKCTGYLNNSCQFYPSLPMECPSFSEDELYGADLTSACRQLIKNLSSCQEPDRETLNNIEPRCRDFIFENINYQACLKHHQDEADFLGNTWYVYLAREKEIWDNDGGQVILKDKEGLVVDRYRY